MVKLQLALLGLYASAVYGDVYMQNPRGSNNRNCRTDNDENRRNANRVFDSQNNDKGGYSCPRTWPFDCYKVVDDGNAFNQCQNQNAGQGKDALDATGQLTNPAAVNTPTMYYYAGSELSVEWTAQHGMGTNSELHSDVIVQYACEDTLNDNCDAATAGQNPITADPNKKVCTLRDGTPIRVADGNNGLNAEATDTIPDNANAQDDMRYGRHESYAYYQECKRRERNKGLYAADQNLNGNDARTTRQNPNANRNGLECPEESEYYPYFHSSPWKDIAIVTSDMTACQAKAAQSQNIVPKGRCQCPAGQCTGDGTQPNNEAACKAKGYTWVMDPAHGLPAPKCVMGQYSRQNHLGNTGSGPNSQAYNMTIPQPLGGKTQRCALRIRYNMSSADFGDASVVATAAQNKQNSPLKDNDENEALTYIPTTGLGGPKAKLSITTNTDQYARTFQDRSYVFEIRPRPAGGRLLQNGGACAKVYNLNVRGKRGNIVQTYPAVEYDFTPDHLVLETNECVHVQWTGSDYNPNRNGNNGEGGPYASNNRNKETKADRSNIVQMKNPADNQPATNAADYTMFKASAQTWKRLTFLDQDIDGNNCLDFAALKAKFNNRANREETHLNCMKLSGAKTPYFDAGVQTPGAPGEYKYISTRNNNFSNRGQKGTLVVKNKVVSTPAPTFGVTQPPPPGVAPTVPPTDPPTSSSGPNLPGAPDGDGAKDQSPSSGTSDIMSSKNLPLLIGVGSALVAAVGFFAYSRTSGGRAPAVTPGGDYQQQQPGFGKRVSTMFQGFQGQWGGQQQQQQYPPQGYYNR